MTFIYDGAYAPNLDAVVAHGGVAMSVYLTGRYSSTTAQPKALFAKGLGVFGNYEEGAGELLTAGRAGGVGIGRRAGDAYARLGAPTGKGLGLAFSVDVNAAPSTFPAIGQAFDGIRAGLAGRYAPKVYGEGALIHYLVTTGRVDGKQWLSASSSFPGFDPGSPDVGMVQLVGTPVPGTDQDHVTDLSGLGIWWPPGSPYASKDIMTTLTDSQIVAQVAAAVWSNTHKAADGVNYTLESFLVNARQDAGVARKRATDVYELIAEPTHGLAITVGRLAATVKALAADVAALKAAHAAGTVPVTGTLTIGVPA